MSYLQYKAGNLKELPVEAVRKVLVTATGVKFLPAFDSHELPAIILEYEPAKAGEAVKAFKILNTKLREPKLSVILVSGPETLELNIVNISRNFKICLENLA